MTPTDTQASWQDVLIAGFAIYLVLEGLMPAIAPEHFRATLQKMSEADAGMLRVLGLGSMIAGACLLSCARP